ncbi:tRNA lysidine(34) synthetase TilS [Halobacillus shinanisalinarum]|uniref:tRNA lysidine(34) synthetase TilS n=1 Tax=Halobacillus shinanisalinarum TaxID=2932258 RepID=A0ABY4GUR9_9BACI|nr:tRNA lysidine(34) synthetase TilS [Halobacillus shinanisalinarum]UOQ91764.1 tRNA lysidine(34) synthetase TilS [Halobacillus shinanisalinarum]
MGAGHAHIDVIRSMKEQPIDDVEVCLISPSEYFYYSGMFSGYTEGVYSLEEIRLDLKKLTQDAGIHFIRKRASRVYPNFKKLFCRGGAVYPFDMISFDIGSKHLPDHFGHTVARSIKPHEQFVEQVNELRKTSHPLIVGGGAGGCELALSLQAYKAREQIDGQVRLVSSSNILGSQPKRMSKKLKSIMQEKRVQLWERERVEEVYEDYIVTSANNKIRHTGVLWLGGPLADPLFETSGIKVDEKGFPLVKATLQFDNYEFMFGVGDCVSLKTNPYLDKSGVHAVKQAPILYENLRRFAAAEELITYQPRSLFFIYYQQGWRRLYYYMALWPFIVRAHGS